MPNVLYDPLKESFLSQVDPVDFDSEDIRVILVDTGAYTLNAATHDYLDDIPGGARIAVSATLTSPTVAAGVFDADNVTFTAVPGPTSVEAIVIYQHTGVDATSRLICYIDTATNLPVTPNGGDITIAWDSGANRIFAL